MQLMVAILPNSGVDPAVTQLVGAGLRVTRLASSGGFLRQGNTTLLVGVEDDRVDEAIVALREALGRSGATEHERSVVYVLDVSRYDQL
jgi:uncharacterized protein YaaQ